MFPVYSILTRNQSATLEWGHQESRLVYSILTRNQSATFRCDECKKNGVYSILTRNQSATQYLKILVHE